MLQITRGLSRMRTVQVENSEHLYKTSVVLSSFSDKRTRAVAMLFVLFSLTLLCLQAANAEIDNYIVNGYVVNPTNSFPWQLSLQRDGSHICGAVVYNNNFALTAAHCVDGAVASRFRVMCGAHNIHTTETQRQTVSVSAITMHPSYNPSGSGFPNDIAVLRLSTPLTFNSYCQAPNLPSASNDYADQSAVITGWGRLYGGGTLPSRLKRGDVEVLSNTKCRTYWGTTISATYHICVKDLGDRIYGGCNGDSGGPASVGNTVVGLASFVASGCLTNYPTAYTRVSSYLSWISSTVASMG